MSLCRCAAKAIAVLLTMGAVTKGYAAPPSEPYQPGQVYTFQVDELNQYARIVIGKTETLIGQGPIVHVVIVGTRLLDDATGQATFTDVWHMAFTASAIDMSVIELEGKIDVPEQFNTAYGQWRENYNKGEDMQINTLPAGLVLKNWRQYLKETPQAGSQDGADVDSPAITEQ